MATSMTSWDALYLKLKNDLLAKRGVGGKGRNGGALPKTSPLDAFGILAAIQPDVVKTVVRLGGLTVKITGKGDGAASATAWFEQGRPLRNADGSFGDPLVRELPPPPLLAGITGDTTWEQYRMFFGEQPEAIKLLVDKWNRFVERAALALAWMPLKPTLPDASTTEWWAALYQLLVAMSVVSAIPSEDYFDKVMGGIKYATVETVKTVAGATKDGLKVIGQEAGKAAAEIAETAGEVGGKFVSGFLGAAGPYALAAVAVAIYLVLP